ALVAVEHPASERDHLPRKRFDGEDDAPAEAVVRLRRALAPAEEPEVEHQVLVQAVLRRRLAQPAPLVRREPEPEPLRGVGVHPARLQVVPGDAATLRVHETLAEPLPGEAVDLVERPVRILFLRATADLPHLHPGARRHVLHRLHEIEPLPLDQKREDVTRFPASEALVEALVGHHVEARCALLVERAVRLVLPAGLLEWHELADDVDDIGSGPHLLDLIVGDHWGCSLKPAMVTPAPPSVGPPMRCQRTRRSASSISATRLRSAPVPLPWMMRSSGRSSNSASSSARASSVS